MTNFGSLERAKENKKKSSRKSSFREGPLLSLDPFTSSPIGRAFSLLDPTQIEMNDVGVIYTLPGFVVVTPSIAFSP